LLILGHQNEIRAIKLLGNFVFSASADSTAQQWDKTTGTSIKAFSVTQTERLSSLAVSEDGTFLFTGSSGPNSFLAQWRVSDGTFVKSLNGFLPIKIN
jgi:WD40 repeat protein